MTHSPSWPRAGRSPPSITFAPRFSKHQRCRMPAQTRRQPCLVPISARAAAARDACRIEPLEGRTLLSAAWETVDDYQLVAGQSAGVRTMTSDPAGNIFATGTAWDPTIAHRIIREKLNGV